MGSRRVEIDFKFRPSEPSPETATTTDLADIALYVNNKVFFGACFGCRIIPDIQGAYVEPMGPSLTATDAANDLGVDVTNFKNRKERAKARCRGGPRANA